MAKANSEIHQDNKCTKAHESQCKFLEIIYNNTRNLLETPVARSQSDRALVRKFRACHPETFEPEAITSE